MSDISPDCELVKAYALQGSESAFRALVRRHVDLVFATALRQTGNAALAEEITQNVFISLARKAPRLGGMETLAGWLYRATVLETKAGIRAELRRRKREQAAFEMNRLEHEGASPLAALIPMLDEALLDLRESDRLALVLRFLEQKNLRDVASVLGVEEDAARKRVARALERVEQFFRKRGFITVTGAASAAFSSTAQAAPAALAAACSKAALSAATSGGALSSLLFHAMKLTNTQAAAACLLVVSAPLAWQHFSQNALASEQSAIDAETARAEQQADETGAEAARIRSMAERARLDAASLTSQLQEIQAQSSGATARPRYHWDDSSPYVRLSKSDLNKGVLVPAVETRRGKLTPAIKELLQMTDDEASQTGDAVKQFALKYDSLEARNMRQVSPKADDLEGHSAAQTRVFDVPYIGSNQMNQMRLDFFGQITSILGGERGAIFTNALGNWIGICSAEAIFNSSFRARFYQPAPGAKALELSVVTAPHRSSMSCSVPADDVPELFQSSLQDWLAVAQESRNEKVASDNSNSPGGARVLAP